MKKPDPSRQLNVEVVKKWVESMSPEDPALSPNSRLPYAPVSAPVRSARASAEGEYGLDLRAGPGQPVLPEGQALKEDAMADQKVGFKSVWDRIERGSNGAWREMDDFLARCEVEGSPQTLEATKRLDAEFLAVLKRCNERALKMFKRARAGEARPVSDAQKEVSTSEVPLLDKLKIL